ncbi:MAG: NrfD/PsrC family molybdoenzyme membrane anchor subunit [Actinomycetales bacterium]
MTTNAFDADRPPEVPRRRRRREDDGRPPSQNRPDPHAMVPPAEFVSYYGQPVIKPLPWGHEIPGYLFVGGVTGASGLIGCWAHTVGLDRLRRNSRISALVGVGVSAGLLVVDLGHPERFLNMMRTMKLTSPMSIGSWILSGFGGFAAMSMGAEIASMLGWDDPRTRTGILVTLLGAAGSAGSALFAAPLASYTAVLLSDTAAPTWHEAWRELPWVFVFSANAAASGLAMITTSPSQTLGPRTLAVGAAAIETAAFLRMEQQLGPLLAEPLHHGQAGKLIKASKVLTIGGAVGAALFGRNRVAAVVSGLALLAGSACTRFGVFEAGVHSAKDPKYTMIPQRERVRKRHADGDGSRDITVV